MNLDGVKSIRVEGEDVVFALGKYKCLKKSKPINYVQAYTNDGFPYATLSMQVGPESSLKDNEFVLKHYGENGQISKDMYKNGLIENTGDYYDSAYGPCAIVRMTDKFKEYMIKEEA